MFARGKHNSGDTAPAGEQHSKNRENHLTAVHLFNSTTRYHVKHYKSIQRIFDAASTETLKCPLKASEGFYLFEIALNCEAVLLYYSTSK